MPTTEEILDEFEYDMDLLLTRLRRRLEIATGPRDWPFDPDDGIPTPLMATAVDLQKGLDQPPVMQTLFAEPVAPEPPTPVTVTLAEFTTALRGAVTSRYPAAAPGTDHHIGIIYAYVQGLFADGIPLSESLRYLMGMLDKMSSRRANDPTYTYHVASLAAATTKATLSEFISEVEIFWKRSNPKALAMVDMAQDNERLATLAPPPPPAPESLAAKVAAMRSTVTAITGREPTSLASSPTLDRSDLQGGR